MRDFGAGLGYLLSGQRWMTRHPRQYAFGVLPGLITLVLYVGAVVAMVVWGGDLTDSLTSFANGWPSPWLGLFRGLFTVAMIALVVLVAVVTFTAAALLVGQPFYDALSERVDRSVSPDGTAPESGLSLARELWIAVRDGIRILIRALLWALLLFVLGFVPVVGQTVVPVIAIFVTGFFLVQELTSVALQRRGMQLRDQLALLRSRRLLAWGFGVPLAVAFLVPVVAVFLMPGAIAGATLLSRELLREPSIDAIRARP
ncbi:EI24 domain-containing protein [Nocardia sp. CDC160]|uniref:EI24 domain-containing protein n=1 Tax=Nocardia sp. CDC160 TaxID=3112166 RepID=UPI002DB63595|nr:EI24 domain-containing protein [Nocardia sp. CDC160]MEC3915710.1 EI24 domain-containing protein [Nocardia sp. CDC160]